MTSLISSCWAIFKQNLASKFLEFQLRQNLVSNFSKLSNTTRSQLNQYLPLAFTGLITHECANSRLRQYLLVLTNNVFELTSNRVFNMNGTPCNPAKTSIQSRSIYENILQPLLFPPPFSNHHLPWQYEFELLHWSLLTGILGAGRKGFITKFS